MYYEGKLFRDENGKVYFNDLDGNGFTEVVLTSSPSSVPNIYRAHLTKQDGESPYVSELVNTTGSTFVWTDTSEGILTATITPSLPEGSKLFMPGSMFSQNPGYFIAFSQGYDTIVIYCIDSGGNLQNLFDETIPFSLEIYS